MAVYLIRAGECDAVKIGYTSDLWSRLGKCQTDNHEPLCVLALIPDGTEEDEQRLHERLAVYRIRGDWFRAAPEVLAAFDGFPGVDRRKFTVDALDHPLARYLSREGIREGHFARTIGVQQSTIHRILRGERGITLALAVKISDATGGEVQPADFVQRKAA